MKVFPFVESVFCCMIWEVLSEIIASDLAPKTVKGFCLADSFVDLLGFLPNPLAMLGEGAL